MYCLGKLPARRGAIKFKLADFLPGTKPIYPPEFGHEELIPQRGWGMNGNDRWGVCLAEGTKVSAPDILGASKLSYSGTLVTILTASGKRLTVTPNHAILTTRGFLRAQCIEHGDNLIGTRGTEILPRTATVGAERNFNQVPTPINEIFSALRFDGLPIRKIMPLAIDLHGDEQFLDGNVEIVRTNSLLWDKIYAALRKPNAQDQVGAARKLQRILVGKGAAMFASIGVLATAYRDMCLSCNGLAFSYAQAGVSQANGLRQGAQYLSSRDDRFFEIPSRNSELGAERLNCFSGNIPFYREADIAVSSSGDNSRNLGIGSPELVASNSHPSGDGHHTDPHLAGNLADAFPGLIEADRVIGIDVQGNVRTHVYDLSTTSRWYLADGLVTHNCTVAGAQHETLLWNKIAGRDVQFSLADVAEDFTAITGHAVGPDVGADMQQAAEYRRTTGLRDKTGARHCIGAYLAIQAGDLQDVLTAAYLFGAVGIGIAMYQSNMDDFAKRRAWGASKNSGFLGYHYVPVVALRSNLVVVSWGRTQAMRPNWFIGNNDEAVAYVSQEDLVNGKSPENFDYQGLLAKLRAI